MTALLDLIDEIEDIKGNLRTAINNKGGSLTTSTPFAKYVTAVNDLPTADDVFNKTLSGEITLKSQHLYIGMLSRNDGITRVNLQNCTRMDERISQYCENLTYVDLPLYQGWSLDETTGQLDRWTNGSGSYAFEGCPKIDTYNAPMMKILPNDTLSGNAPLSTINVPNLIGLGRNAIQGYWDSEQGVSVTYYDVLKNHNIDFMSMKYLEDPRDLIYYYCKDTDNNITDTLTFDNLICVEGSFMDINNDDDSYVLNNITTINLPALKYISDWVCFRFNGTSLSLPSIYCICDGAFNECPNLTTVSIGSNVHYIAGGAFQNQSQSVTTVNIDIDRNTQDEQIINNVINTAPWGFSEDVTINWRGEFA